MSSLVGLESYRSHTLNIAMQTSSGDKITLDFSNENAASLMHSEDKNGSSTALSFSSMQSFAFSMQSNGIDAQDQKEIDAFMEVAKPFIDNFLEELKADAPKTPVTKLANDIASIFDPQRERSQEGSENIKANIVKLFDNAITRFEPPKVEDVATTMERIFKETQNLLEKTLQNFENFGTALYA